MQEFFHIFVLNFFLVVILLQFLRVLWKSFSEKQGAFCVLFVQRIPVSACFRTVTGKKRRSFVTLLFPPVFFQTAACGTLFPISEKILKQYAARPVSPRSRGRSRRPYVIHYIIARRTPLAELRAFVDYALSSALPEVEFGDLYKVGYFASSLCFPGLKKRR